MKFYIDENIPKQIGHALRILQEPMRSTEDVEVFNIIDEFGPGTADEDWIPEIAKSDSVVITQDYNIQRTRNQRILYQEHGLGIVFLKPPSKGGFGYWMTVKKIIDAWEEIKKVSRKEKRPFAYVIRPRSKNLELL